MDRAMENLLIRLFGSFAFAALLIHAGLSVEGRAWPALYLAPFFVLAVAANWALARLNAKRAALKATTVLLGALPLLVMALNGDALAAGGVRQGVLAAAGAFGAATLAMGLALLRKRAAPGDAEAADTTA